MPKATVGDQSGGQSTPKQDEMKTPVHSRQGIEQHQIDVDLLVQKLLQIPNVEILDSIFEGDPDRILNIDLQPSNGTNDMKFLGDSLVSSGRASEIQSSGIMTPRS